MSSWSHIWQVYRNTDGHYEVEFSWSKKWNSSLLWELNDLRIEVHTALTLTIHVISRVTDSSRAKRMYCFHLPSRHFPANVMPNSLSYESGPLDMSPVFDVFLALLDAGRRMWYVPLKRRRKRNPQEDLNLSMILNSPTFVNRDGNSQVLATTSKLSLLN
jgi:hypothetical protein